MAAVVALFAACTTAIPSQGPQTPVSNATVRSSATPKPTSMPLQPPPSAVTIPAGPPPTIPPPRTWSAGGIAADLPAGWSDPPAGMWIALVFALDELADPPAGLYSMLLKAGTRGTGEHFAFRDQVGGPPTAALEARWIPADGRSLNQVVHAAAADLRGVGIDVARSRTNLAIGSTPCLAWDQPVRLGSIRIRACFIQLTGGIARLDVGTLEDSSRDLRRELRRILNSVRPIGG